MIAEDRRLKTENNLLLVDKYHVVAPCGQLRDCTDQLCDPVPRADCRDRPCREDPDSRRVPLQPLEHEIHAEELTEDLDEKDEEGKDLPLAGRFTLERLLIRRSWPS